MTITLINKGRIKTFVLLHKIWCEALGECCCAPLPGDKERRAPASLTIPAGATAQGLSDAVLSLPDVKKAVIASELVVILEPDKKRKVKQSTDEDKEGEA